MDMRRIAISAAWSSFVRQKEWSESIAGNHYTDFDALYRQYYPRILVFLCFLVGKPEVAEDLASLVFEKALVHLADMQAPDTAGPWLFRVARIERLHGPLMRLLHPHAPPTLDLPPAQSAVTVSTDQPLPTGSPDYRRDHSRLPPKALFPVPQAGWRDLLWASHT